MGVVKPSPKKRLSNKKNYSIKTENGKNSQQTEDWLNLVIETENPFKPGVTYKGLTNGLEKCPIKDGREQVRLKVTLNSRGHKKSFYKYIDIDMYEESKYIKFLKSMNAIDTEDRIVLERLQDVAVKATLFQTKSGSMYIADVYKDSYDVSSDENVDDDYDDDDYIDDDYDDDESDLFDDDTEEY